MTLELGEKSTHTTQSEMEKKYKNNNKFTATAKMSHSNKAL
jgi:hypothetical protein